MAKRARLPFRWPRLQLVHDCPPRWDGSAVDLDPGSGNLEDEAAALPPLDNLLKLRSEILAEATVYFARDVLEMM